MNLDERAINVFTDGSSLPSPRRGGSGICIVTVNDAGHEVIDEIQPQGYQGATNQEMELKACTQALHELRGKHSPVDLSRFSKVVIRTDSQYVADNLYNARFVWPTQRWFGSEGNPIVNAKLWKELIKEIGKVGMRVEILWSKGHSAKNPHNKTADKLAKQSAKGVLQEPLDPVRVRRKLSDKQTLAGRSCQKASASRFESSSTSGFPCSASTDTRSRSSRQTARTRATLTTSRRKSC